MNASFLLNLQEPEFPGTTEQLVRSLPEVKAIQAEESILSLMPEDLETVSLTHHLDIVGWSVGKGSPTLIPAESLLGDYHPGDPVLTHSLDCYLSSPYHKQNISPRRLYEVSEKFTSAELVILCSGVLNIPGRREFLLICGHVEKGVDEFRVSLVPTDEKIEAFTMTLETAQEARGMVRYHGDQENPHVFHFEAMSDRSLVIRGLNPRIYVSDPKLRVASKNMFGVLAERQPSGFEFLDAKTQTENLKHLLKKASTDSSKHSSASFKSDMTSSVQTRVVISSIPETDQWFMDESKRNTLILDKMRFMVLSIGLLERILGLVCVSGAKPIEERDMVIEGIHKGEGSLEEVLILFRHFLPLAIYKCPLSLQRRPR